MLTRGELDGLTAVTAVTVLAHILTSAWAAWVQDRDLRRLGEEHGRDLDALWQWCHDAAAALGWTDDGDQGPGDDGHDPTPDDPEPTPPGEEPDTVISHPADTFARQQALLARYAHIGQHRP